MSTTNHTSVEQTPCSVRYSSALAALRQILSRKPAPREGGPDRMGEMDGERRYGARVRVTGKVFLRLRSLTASVACLPHPFAPPAMVGVEALAAVLQVLSGRVRNAH